MTRVLVTGGSGFIGRHAIDSLQAQGLDIIAPSSQDYDLTNIEHVRDLLAFSKPDILLHLAWITSHGQYWTAAENRDWAAAGKIMLDVFFQQGGQRAVIAGTCAEYDWQNVDSVLTESAPLAPHTLYGQSKLDLFRHAETLIAQGASICWGRLFLLYGHDEGAKRFVPDVILSLLQDGPAHMSPGTQIRDFMHAHDAGAAFAHACLTPAVTGAVNIAQGEPVSLLQVAERLQALIGKGQLDPGYYPMRPDDPPRLVPDITRLRHEMGFTPSFSLDSGLQDVVRWWQKQGDDDGTA